MPCGAFSSDRMGACEVRPKRAINQREGDMPQRPKKTQKHARVVKNLTVAIHAADFDRFGKSSEAIRWITAAGPTPLPMLRARIIRSHWCRLRSGNCFMPGASMFATCSIRPAGIERRKPQSGKATDSRAARFHPRGGLRPDDRDEGDRTDHEPRRNRFRNPGARQRIRHPDVRRAQRDCGRTGGKGGMAGPVIPRLTTSTSPPAFTRGNAAGRTTDLLHR